MVDHFAFTLYNRDIRTIIREVLCIPSTKIDASAARLHTDNPNTP
jgi:hypothetical protein